MLLVKADQMQAMDNEAIKSFGIPGLVLMENAGRGAFDFLLKSCQGQMPESVAVIAGRGNNGGDGFVIARYLMEKNIQTSVYLLSSKEKVQGDAKVNMDLFLKLCQNSSSGYMFEIPNQDTFERHKNKIRNHDLFVDAILGTGLNSDVRGFFKDAIELLNSSDKPVFSIDIPSGLHSDTGQPLGVAVKADNTATFAFTKVGHILYPGNLYTGNLETIDIGIPKYIAEKKDITLSLIDQASITSLFKPRSFTSHKGSFGHLLVIAGSPGKTGAAALCANAAMRSGTGLVTLGVAKGLEKRIEPMVVEPMTHALPEKQKRILTDHCTGEVVELSKDKQALAIGPGIGTKQETAKLVYNLIKNIDLPLIIDADGLNCLAENIDVLKQKKGPVILTPHPGEMARLCKTKTATIQADRIKTASDFAKTHDVILILKGAQTVISLPDGKSAICPTGNPGMASGGMGDVLTGIIAGFCAQGMPPGNAAMAGTYIHGMCADILAEEKGGFGFLATDMINSLPETIHQHLI